MHEVDRSPLGDRFIDTLAQVDGHTGHHANRDTGPFVLDRPVDVTADQRFDLRVALDDRGQRRCLLGPAVAADVVVIDIERWMMNE